MRNKKAQLTIFIILGIVIVVIVGFVMFGSRYTERQRSETEVSRVKQATFDMSPIETHVTDCIKKATEESLLLLVKQGGYIFTSQGGTLLDFDPSYENVFFVNHEGDKVAYNIYPQRLIVEGFNPNPPTYPKQYFPYDTTTAPPPGTDLTSTTIPLLYEGQFGVSQLPPLMEESGAHSMHLQIGEYIKNNINDCVDFSIFERQGFEIIQGDFSTDVTITKRSVSVHVIWPLRITQVVTEQTNDLKDFYTNVDVRLFELHAFLESLIGGDITDIRFDIAALAQYVNGFEVNVVRDINENKDDLIIVKDTASNIKGQQIEYKFARHNRNPALVYLNSCPAQCSFPVGTLSEADLPDYPIQALDPDEDEQFNMSISFEPELSTISSAPDSYEVTVYANDGILTDWQTITINIG